MGNMITHPDQTMTGRAFHALTPMHQSLLWKIEVERLSLTEATERMGIGPKEAVIQLSTARLRLYSKWVEMQERNPRLRPACQQNVNKLRAFAKSRLDATEEKRVQSHLKACLRCAMLAKETDYLASHLRIALRPNRALFANDDPSFSPAPRPKSNVDDSSE